MNFLKKLTGLFVFVAAIAGAVAVSRYFSGPRPVAPVEAPSPPPPVALTPPAIARDPDPALGNSHPQVRAAQVTFRAQLVTLNFKTQKSHITLELEPDRSLRPAPERVWVWASFFSPDESGRCEAEPVEVRQPFARGDRATIVVEADASRCRQPPTPAATIYARVNVSAESAASARLADSQLSTDISQATPVVVSGTGR